MNYEQLKSFILVSEKSNFSEAAKVLHLSQPSVTAHIKSLEIYLNTKLFERTTKQVSLTSGGRELFGYAKEIVKLTEKAEKAINSLEKQTHGMLNVACSLTIGEHIIPRLLGEFKQAYPFIQLSVDVTNTNVILSMIKNHVLDIGLIEAPIVDADLLLEPFMEDELVLIAKPNYFSGIEEISLDVLMKSPLVLREEGSGTRKVMDQHLIKHGVHPKDLNIEIELGSTEAVKLSVESGLGVSILSKNAISKELKLGTLQIYPIKDVAFSRYFYLVYHRDTVLKTTVESFIKFIFACLSDNNKNIKIF